MAIGEIAVLIPIVGMSIPIVGLLTRHKRQMVELRIRELEAKANSGMGVSSAVEDRLRVLERIVTERGFNLAAAIWPSVGQTPAWPVALWPSAMKRSSV